MSRAVAADGAEIAWTSVGEPENPTAVFLHSLGCDSTMWQGQVDALSESHRVVSVDLRGHGCSDAPPGRYSLDTLGTDVIAVVDAIGADRVTVCGISIGGLVALWMAIRHPDRVTSLVAANTAARIGSIQGWNDRIRLVGEEGMEAIAERIVGNWFMPGFAERRPDIWDRALATFRETSAVGYTGCCAALEDADLRGEVGSITAPALVIGGDGDGATPPAQAEWLRDHIPGSDLVVIPDAAHLSNLEQPGVFTRTVRQFVSTLPQ